ncbi:PREDICTED: nicastrin isoform X1 [Polistes canadensis]|uniref:nicastrin isoform X1 n=2 Tax=Polistes canadensis TaxID=91411 RepID=UPI000719071E|nr:PREDICTED: nicastrin isoform X1 [Polistes canadensis]XP_014607332.1 PREDICTED: nicastrin isoform X1 [Polistes canadensis]
MAKYLTWKYLFLLVIIQIVNAKRIKDMIYMSVDGAAGCFRRHNGTHQFGCSSSRSGSVGVIHLIEQEDDVRWLETKATAGPYTAVLPFSMFTRDILLRLKNTNNINGVLLARNTSKNYPDFYSPEDTCPNRYSNYKKCNDKRPWNPHGSSILLEDWPFPMFYMENQTLLEAIKSCFWNHNAHDLENQSERSLCALEMKSFMFSAINSDSCIKRSDFYLNINPTSFCDPLGDRNIHWPLAPLKSDSNSVIMVTSRIDASSMFDGISPGALSTITGIVSLLATATYLNSLKPYINNTNVVFTLLNGEAFDYIGSSRLVYDLKEGHFNALGGISLKLNEILTVIELSQLSKGDLFLHVSNNKTNTMISQLTEGLQAKVLSNSVPPTSVQSFLETEPSLTTIVITNYPDQFTNNYYNSILDNAKSLNFNRNDTNDLASSLTNISVTLAETLYYNVTGVKAPSGDVNRIENIISEMLSCYLESAKCNLFHAASSPGTKLADQILPLYVSVHRVPNTVTILTGQLLALLTGEILEMNETACYDHHHAWMGGYNLTGICINSTVNYSIALSPAFIISDYDMKSGIFSTWTESIWQMLSVRMFLKPSAATERLSMILGSIVTSTSFILVWFINSKADILFNSRRAVDC